MKTIECAGEAGRRAVRLVEYDSTDSVLDRAKELTGEGRDTAVVARRQTRGRGRKGRAFESEEGGLYLALLRFYDGFPLSRAFEISGGACLAVRRTLAAFGVSCDLKWPNDVLFCGKKIGGILIENGLGNGAEVRYAAIGIGVNVNNVLPASLGGIATSMREAAGREFDLAAVRDRLVAELYRPFSREEYRAALVMLGAAVTVRGEGEAYDAVACDVADDGRLIVRRGEEFLFLSAADVTVRKKERE